jgi:MFS family permease
LQVWRGFSSRQKRLIIGIGSLDFFTFCCLSMIGPFFPAEASKKGMSTAASGFVFSLYSIIVVIFSPVFGYLLPFIGTKFGIVAGSFVAAYCCVLFGILDAVGDETTFAAYCFVVRSVEALGAALYNIAIFSLICEHFRGHLGAVLSIGSSS